MDKEKKVSGRVTSKGQVTIPVEVRKALNIEEGDRLEFIREEGGGYKVKAVKKKSLRQVLGRFHSGQTIPLEKAREIAHEKVGREYLLNDLDEENRP